MSKLIKVIHREQCIGCLSCMQACARRWQQEVAPSRAALGVEVYPGVEGAFSIRLCYGCLEPDCAEACPTGALKPRRGGGVKLDPSLCQHCADCVKACIPSALMWDHEKKIPIPCRHCGLCAVFCPNNVLKMVESS